MKLTASERRRLALWDNYIQACRNPAVHPEECGRLFDIYHHHCKSMRKVGLP